MAKTTEFTVSFIFDQYNSLCPVEKSSPASILTILLKIYIYLCLFKVCDMMI